MTDLAEMKAAKALARREAGARRDAAHATAAGAVAAALVAHLDGVTGRIVSGYLPIRSEADPLPAMTRLAAANRIVVPVVEGRGRPLAFREWTAGVPLVEGNFGVMIPAEGAFLSPDLLIVPMLAFDRRGIRLGYGGGFYDRTLEGLRAAGPVEAVGFAFAAQEVPALPAEATDQPLDRIVTEAGVLSFGAAR